MDRKQFLEELFESIWDAVESAFQKQSISAINVSMGGTRIDKDGVGDVDDVVTIFVADSAMARRIKEVLNSERNPRQ